MWAGPVTTQREKQNRELTTFGYTRQYRNLDFIPLDIIKLIFKFYDNGVRWTINDIKQDKNNNIQQFLSCKLQDTMYGPIFEPIPGMICQLTISPNGWNFVDKGYVMCYFEVHKVPQYVKNVTLSFVLYLKQFNYEYIKTVCYHPFGLNKCHGWSNAIQLNEIKRKKLSLIQIECITDIIHVEYKKSMKKCDIVSIVRCKYNCEFEWNISMELLDDFKNTKNQKLFYSDTIYNNCWMLRCAPCGFNFSTRGNLWLFLQLIRIPFRMKSIRISFEIKACYTTNLFGDSTTEERGENRFSLDMDGADGWGRVMFPYSALKNMNSLSFRIKTHILDIHTYQ